MLRTLAAIAIFTLLAGPAMADTTAHDLMPGPDDVIRKILGLDEMSRNICVIDSRQMVNAADLPGRLVVISPALKVPSEMLRFSFRKPDAKITTQVHPPTDPIQITRIESSVTNSGSLMGWLGASMSKDDIAEIKTVPMPATSISVDSLDEKAISDKFTNVPESTRKGLGIVTDVIPYEVWASVCKKTTGKLQAGIWYIKLGKDTYAQQSDQLKRYYLVAVYTPLVFYSDIGVIPSIRISTVDPDDTWKPSKSVKSRDEAFDLWMKERGKSQIKFPFGPQATVGGPEPPAPPKPKPGAPKPKDH